MSPQDNNEHWVARFFDARSEPQAESDLVQDAATNSNPPPPSSSNAPSSLAIFAVIMGIIAALVLAFIGWKFLKRRRARSSSTTEISAGVYEVDFNGASPAFQHGDDDLKTPRPLAVPKTPGDGVSWAPQVKSIRGPVYDPEKDAADVPLPPTPRTPHTPRHGSMTPRTPRTPHGFPTAAPPVPPMPSPPLPGRSSDEPAFPPGYGAEVLTSPAPPSPNPYALSASGYKARTLEKVQRNYDN
ncbi:hypothetical protein CONPUDRAFT_162133 [Coniophora puteana RWD-64-598 SS2]|uniref:Uncharacterized protein n=1 Tax=Coniophora puteana (strain RWD-64-598) TaxID=741705 RepID=A0A5M3N078_CONPW|nr:uncharacterized protein CONPUDRAFT_162133 [Coniophora puteana RWD-64-598 SS2]EIW84789.1 hypothetical protein CONPUDRAFT_162133 [Coniophora puteana RWD-64-598 SS2]